ncbi:hypothetical protein LEP1GSC096_0059 [Leptospira interrogans serovar Hebdomadis str. R499]|nr:hypothetical protein LEP1GSC096_0059 [Leptospira interrogans serovar Hebdomadis str. R499]
MKPWILFKERPILFSSNMVRAILDGNKTQTRRLNGLREINKDPDNWEFVTTSNSAITLTDKFFVLFVNKNIEQSIWVKCPLGLAGDHLWVRETFGRTQNVSNLENWPGRFHKRVDEDTVYIYRADDGWWEWTDYGGFPTEKSHWKPSIHMPREASRITLEIKNIRVERLQDISESDTEAEGIEFMRDIPDADESLTGKQLFEVLWESINSLGSWKQNPWVWVIEFEKK